MNSKFVLITGCDVTFGLTTLVRRSLAIVLLLLLSACGGDGVSTTGGDDDLTSPLPIGIDENGNLVPGAPGQPPVSSGDLALLPVVAVNARQIADPDVLIRLQGSVVAAADAEIVQTLWVQVLGPSVVIEEPGSLEQLVQVPNVTSTALLQFRLTALDSEGRINSASVSVVVQPVEDVEGPEEKLVQVIQFLEPGPFDVELGASFSNSLDTSAAPQGIGAVIYESSNSSVASVDANGLVSALSEGTADITVTRAEDNVYLPASDSYTIVVVPPSIEPVPDFLAFDAFIGGLDTQFNFKYPVTGYEFIRTSDPECTPFNECTALVTDVLQGTSIVDNPTLSSTSYFWLASDDQVSLDVVVDGTTRGDRTDAPPARGDHGLVATADRLWLVAGIETDQSENTLGFYDVWSSADAVSWAFINEQMVEERDFNESPEIGVSDVVVYGNALWLIVETDEFSVVYHSTDGVQWIREERTFQSSAKLAVFEDRLFLYETTFDPDGGNTFELWQYTSATGWSTESQTVNLIDIFSAGFVEFNGSLWMFAGYASDQVPVRISTDGVTWPAVETDSGESFLSFDFQALVFKDQLWFFNYELGTIYRSADGLKWEAVESDRGFFPSSAKVVVFNNKLWMHGGIDFGSNDGEITRADTWVSDDGVSWRKVYRGEVYFQTPLEPM
jgi:hypothetical protein